MGDDTPIRRSRACLQACTLFAPALRPGHEPGIDPLRETLVMSLRMHLGRRGSLLTDRPAGLRWCGTSPRPPGGGDGRRSSRRRRQSRHPRRNLERPPRERPPTPCAPRSTGCVARRPRGARGGGIVILSDRAADRNARRSRCSWPWGPYTAPARKRPAEATRSVAEAGDAWDVHHFRSLIGYGAEAVHPWLALESVQAQVAEDDAARRGSAPPRRRASSRSFRRWASRHSPPTAAPRSSGPGARPPR